MWVTSSLLIIHSNKYCKLLFWVVFTYQYNCIFYFEYTYDVLYIPRRKMFNFARRMFRIILVSIYIVLFFEICNL